MGRLHDELGGSGPWEDLFVPRDAAGDGAPRATWQNYNKATSAPAPVVKGGMSPYAAAHPEAAVLLARLRFSDPFRLRRLSRDLKWLRKQAIKQGIDPEEIRWLL